MRKYSPEEKIKIIEGYLKEEYSLQSKVQELGYNSTPGCLIQMHLLCRKKDSKGAI